MANQGFSQSEQSSIFSSVKDSYHKLPTLYHTNSKGLLPEYYYDANAGKVQCSMVKSALSYVYVHAVLEDVRLTHKADISLQNSAA